MASEQSLLEIDLLKAGKMGKCRDPSDFDNVQTVALSSSIYLHYLQILKQHHSSSVRKMKLVLPAGQ